MTTNITDTNPFDDFVPSEISDAQFLENLNGGRQREKLREVSEANATLQAQNAGIELAIRTMQQVQETSAKVASREQALTQAATDSAAYLANLDADVKAHIAAELLGAANTPRLRSEWLDIFGDEPMPADGLTLNQAWGELQATPSYVERDLSQVAMFIEVETDPLAGVEDDIRTGDIPLVLCEDRLIHSDDRPFCEDENCPCHTDDDLFDEHILEPVLAGLMTTAEALMILWNEQV